MIWSGKFRGLVQNRIIARIKKDYVLADQYREELKTHGIEISEEGTDERGDTYCIWGPVGEWSKESTWLSEKDIPVIEEQLSHV
jgi:hypothetical protein